jgi:hypothetical protein
MVLVWLAIERTRNSRCASLTYRSGVPSSWRFDCMRRHDTHGATVDERPWHPTKKPTSTIATWNFFTQCRNRTVTKLKCGTTQCKNPVNCDKAIQVRKLSSVIPAVAASVTAIVCSGMLRFAPRLAGTLLIPLALAGSAPSLGAQRLSDSTASGKITHPHPRALILGIVGAIAGGLAGYGFGKGAGRGGGGGMTFVGVAAGGLAGFFIGRQLDERRAISYRGTPSLKIPNVGITLEGDPSVLTVRDGTAAVGGSAGVELFSAMDARLLSLGTRAIGLHGISAIDIAPRSSWLALGSRTGLYIYPPNKGPGVLVKRATVNAIAAADTRIFIATDNRVESVPVNADSERVWPGTTLSAPVRDIELDEARAVLWASTDRDLVALRISGDSLVVLGSVPLAGAGLRVVIDRGLAAVAMGEKGVALVDISDPQHPKSRTIWTDAHFAYDVSIDGPRLFVAAGPEGVYLVNLSGDAPKTIGLARSLGFASAIASHDGHTFILDRRTNALRRIISTY